jgi:hypothetical protein
MAPEKIVRVLATVAMSFVAMPAVASGGLSCESEGGAATIVVESGVTRGMGSPVFNFRASVDIDDLSVAADLRMLEFDDEHLAQYWLDGEELKMVIYRERTGDAPHGYVEIVMRTTAGEEGSYDGSYALTVFDVTGGEGKTVTLDGSVSCFVE